MSRPLCIEFAGTLYHITSTEDRRDDVFEDDTVRASFLSILDKTSDIHDWVSHPYCLMDNHYHPPYQNSQCESVNANLSKGMRQLNGESLTRKLQTEPINK
jgi:putative transposase